MKLLSIEPTPSPNTMKLNLDESLPPGVRHIYKPEEAARAPEWARRLLAIDGVKSVFHAADFIAVDRMPNADWQRVLAEIGAVLGGEAANWAVGEAGGDADGFGESQVLVQMYRGIPIQIRVRTGRSETRAGLPERFAKAVSDAAGATMIRERVLHELGVRYGEPAEIAAEVAQEIDAAYPDERLKELVEHARAMGTGEQAAPPPDRTPLTPEQVAERLDSPDWQVRYAALERLQPEPAALPVIARALRDEKASLRRLAVVYLGDLRTPEAMQLLIEALRDPSPAVRRTAGDTLSDIGDPIAIGPMIRALSDPNKLVRWRAARFLYEAGDESAVEALRTAAEDTEFEVALQAKMALERIERGEAAAGSVWQQMTKRGEAGRD
jgi:hypothetical protein